MTSYSLYQNNRNPHKFIILKRYSSGHYYWRQYMSWINDATGDTVVNDIGGKNFKRVTLSTFVPVLSDDYTLIGGGIWK